MYIAVTEDQKILIVKNILDTAITKIHKRVEFYFSAVQASTMVVHQQFPLNEP